MPRFWRRRGAGTALRAARDDEAPGDQRPGVAGPAGLDRQRAEVDVVAVDDDLAGTAARRTRRRPHVPQRLAPSAAAGRRRCRPFGGSGSFRLASTPADVAQPATLGRAHAQRDPAGGAEEVGQAPEFCNRPGFRTAVPGRRTQHESLTAVISSRVETGSATRRRSPGCSSTARKSRKIAIFHIESRYEERFDSVDRVLKRS